METRFFILFYLLVAIIFTSPLKIMAQLEKSDVISLSVRINEPLEIALGNEAVFFEISPEKNLKNGTGNKISEYLTSASVSSSSNLNMKVIALKPMKHEDGYSEISLNTIGFNISLGNDETGSAGSMGTLDQSNFTKTVGTNIDGVARNLNILWEIDTENLLTQNLKPGNYSTAVMVLFFEEI